MKVPDPIDDARRLLQSRLAEIDEEVGKLGRAIESLGGRKDSDRRRPGRAPNAAAATSSKPDRRGARRGKGVRRAARGQRGEELLAAIKAAPGARPSELAEAMGVRSSHVSLLIAKARAENLIVRRGDGYALKA
jgi:MarR family